MTKNKTKITILGSGTSSGVPLLGCQCKTCTSQNPKNMRHRASACIEANGQVFLIDTTPDLKQQVVQNKIYHVDAVLYTHPHADHLHGIDDLRSFNFVMKKSIPCFGNSWTISTIYKRFNYIFNPPQQKGGGVPSLTLHLMQKTHNFNGLKIYPLALKHGKLPVLGFRIKDIAYITDCSYIPQNTFRYLKKLEILVLDCLRPREHSTHLNTEQAIELAKKIGAEKTYFTHMGHEIEYEEFARTLPKNMYPAYDGLKINAS